MNQFKESLRHFSAALENPTWIEQSDYIIHDFDHAVESSGLFVERDTRVEDRVVISNLEWVGEGDDTLSSLYRDFWKLYGTFAELEQFVSTVLEPDSITFIVVSGNSQNNPHGHLLRIRIIGHRATDIVKEHNAIGRELRRC